MKKHRYRTEPEEVLFTIYTILSITNYMPMSRGRSKIKNWIFRVIFSAVIVAAILGFAFAIAGTYYSDAYLYSNNLLAGQTVNSIDYFGYNCTIPASTTLKVMFSQDGTNWYSATHVADTWTDLSDGSHLTSGAGAIALSGFNPEYNFYYKAQLANTDTSVTPTLIQADVLYNNGSYATTTTQAATDVAGLTATGNGNITGTGSSSVTKRGFQYGISQTSGLLEASETGSFSTGAYTLALSNLYANTLYNIRSFVQNTEGRAYGSWQTFTTNQYYNTSGTLVSANLLSGLSGVGGITGFPITAALPSGTSATAQFSQDSSTWVAADGTGGTTAIADGTNTISLSGLGWTGANFYYKIVLNANASYSSTPTITSVGVNYSPTDSYWVGGTGNWSDAATHWACSSGGGASAGCAPGAATNVHFDSSSGSGTATIDTASVSVANFDESSTNITVATSTNGITITGDATVNGTVSGATAVTFSGTGKTITMGNSSTISAPLTLGANATVSIAGSDSATISGIISEFGGARSLSKTGTGTLILTASETYTGATIISTGTFQLGNAGATGALSASSAITLNGVLAFNRTNAVSQGTDFASAISAGTGGITQAGANTLALSGNNGFSGGVTIQNGTVSLATSANAAGTGAITLGNGTNSNSVTLMGDGRTFANAIILANISAYTGTATISNSATGCVFSGGIIGTNNFTTTTVSSYTLELSGAINNAGTITNAGAGTGNTTISGVIGSNVTGITQNSATSGLTLSGNNSTVGGVTISAGTLTLSASKNLNVSGGWTNSVGASGFSAGSGSTITFTSGTHALTGATTFNNLILNANNTVTFPASTTQTVNGDFTCTGTAGNSITINSSIGGTKAVLSKASGTVSCDYMSITDSSATGGAAWHAGAHSSGTNYDGWLDLNVAPNVPTLVSPADASYTSDTTPTLSANYSDNDAGDTGTTNYRISSSSLADCTNNINVVASGASSETASNNANTTWTPGSSIGSDGTYYWCAQNNDGVDTSAWTQMATFILDTSAPTTSDNFANNDTWQSGNQTITLTPNCNVSGCNWTKYCQDAANTCDPAAGTAYSQAVAISTEGISYFRYASQDNAANTQTTVSRTVKIDKSAPVTASDGNGYTFGTWANSNVTVSLTCVDGGGSGCLATLYCTDASNTCVPSTPYTTNVVVSTQGTSYIRYFSTDPVSNTESVSSKTIMIDTSAPSVDAGPDITRGSAFFRNASSSDSVSGIASYQWSKVSGGGVITFEPSTAEDTTISANTNDTYVIRLTVTDNAGNSAADSFTLLWDTENFPSAGGTGYNATTYWPEQVSQTQTSVPAPAQIPAPAPSSPIISQIADRLNNLKQQALDIVAVFDLSGPKSQIQYPSIQESVPAETPVALQGWDVMEVKPLNDFSLVPINQDVAFFADKIPQFSQALAAIGIDIKNTEDIKKINGVDLYVPGLTHTILTDAEILEINKFKYSDLQGLSEIQINSFASAQGVPLADLTPEIIQNIPTDIVFARSSGGLIDYGMALSVDRSGLAQQTIKTIAGKPMDLVIRPDHPVKRVIGFITLKKADIGQTQMNILGYITKFLTASIVSPVAQQEQNTSKEGLLLIDKFAFAESVTGVYKATVDMPKTEGEYDISTIIEYKDINLAPKETKMTAIVNPEGYVYSQLPDGRMRIRGASVLLYWQNPQTKQYEVWPADKFLQKNPIITDETGKYSFLVPGGTYKLEASAPNYTVFQSESFEMKEDIAVNKDIELHKKQNLWSWFSWQLIITVLLCIMIAYNFWQNERIRSAMLIIFRRKIKK